MAMECGVARNALVIVLGAPISLVLPAQPDTYIRPSENLKALLVAESKILCGGL